MSHTCHPTHPTFSSCRDFTCFAARVHGCDMRRIDLGVLDGICAGWPPAIFSLSAAANLWRAPDTDQWAESGGENSGRSAFTILPFSGEGVSDHAKGYEELKFTRCTLHGSGTLHIACTWDRPELYTHLHQPCPFLKPICLGFFNKNTFLRNIERWNNIGGFKGFILFSDFKFHNLIEKVHAKAYYYTRVAY